MKRIILAALVGVMVSLFSARLAALENMYTGNAWQNICQTDSSLCIGFLMGFDNAVQYSRELEKSCSPELTTYGQRKDILNNYLSARPESRHLNLAILISRAFAEAWPCK
jgi:hypothetical protein